MQKIAIIGAHGVGKTELCGKLLRYCKCHNKRSELVKEVVRTCPFPIHEKQSIETTLWIICTQIALELEAEKKHPDFVVCDRSILDPIVYLLSANQNEVNQDVVEFAEKYSKSYDKLYLVKPSNSIMTEDGFRNTDPEFQYSIHAIFTQWLVGRCQIIDQNEIFNDVDDNLCKRILGG